MISTFRIGRGGKSLQAALVLVVVLLLAPSAAQAAIGPASFQRTTGAALTAQLPAGGLQVYSTSPAYMVLRDAGATGAIERYAASHNFPWVGVPDPTPGHRGTNCFRDAHLVTTPSLVNAFVEGQLSYHGLLLQYWSSYFRRGDLNPRHCGLGHSSGTVVPTVALSGKHATLHFDCLTGSCSGRVAVFRSASGCSSVTVLANVSGCQPVLHGSFFVPGGRSVSLNVPVPLFSLRFASMMLAVTINGKLQVRSALHSLKPIQTTPRKPRRASITAVCGAGGRVGSSVGVSGSLTPGGARAPVMVTFTGPTGTSTTTSVTSAPPGAYATRFIPTSAGNWTAKASFIGDRNRTAASSRSCAFTVTSLGPLGHVPPPGQNR